MRRFASLVLLAAAAGAAWHFRSEWLRYIPAAVITPSAHERYAAAIRTKGLDDTELGRAWLEAAARALEEARDARPSFTASGEFDDVAHAVASWRFAARRGQRITAAAGFDAGDVFVDLYEAAGEEPVASAAPDTPQLMHDVERDGEFVLRVQPELLRGGRYEVRQLLAASLRFPVDEVGPRAVRGVFGDARDDGRRRHEGIDIFAPRGTPAVAAADGWVTGAATNRLGGNVVWLWSPSRRVALCYAHLDRQAVSRGQQVRAGEVVGYVGTTGNAAGTAPHLHFGIYPRSEGAVDPLPFVCDPPCRASR